MTKRIYSVLVLAVVFVLQSAMGFGGFGGFGGLGARAAQNNDYPTVVIADYVFGCMASNGQTRPALEKCSCSIDVIASLISHEQYVKAETILSMRLIGGEKSATFRGSAWMKEAVAKLKRAQAEAEVRCF